MLKNKKGYSLTVLIIAIAVIIIITSTAVISIKNLNKDKDISSFMNDLADVKQYVIEYFAKESTLPVVLNDSGDMISAELELIRCLSGDEELNQLDEMDTGGYYFVDITKLGKIHLNDNNRGYIVNEGTLNIYVTKSSEYKGSKYYTLTPYLLGKDNVVDNSASFEIVVMGNPITWSNKAEILISVPNVKISEADGWNFKWAKGSKSVSDFKTASMINYFNYGETITFNENGIYTIYVENPEGKGKVRKVVVSKIDDIPPTIKMVSGELIIDDAETGVKSIRCKIKETERFPISSEARTSYPEYYTSRNESFEDTPEDAVANYLWEDKNIRGDTIDEYLSQYKDYYNQYILYNESLLDPNSTSGEITNTLAALKLLNSSYPQFASDNKTFPNEEKNIVIYVEDVYGNGTVYSAISRNELATMQYTIENGNTLLDADIVINDNDIYTNSTDVSLFLKAMHAKYYFVTDEIVDTADWKIFNSNKVDFTISGGDGEKIVYAFFKDEKGKIVSDYDKIILDETPPSDIAPEVRGNTETLSIIPKQTDTKIVDGKETQSGLSGVYQYGIKENGATAYMWYNRVSGIPKLTEGKTYKIVTKATDKAGNEQISQEATLNVVAAGNENSINANLAIGDYVEYAGDSTNSYTLSSSLTGNSSENGKELKPVNTTWRVWNKKADGSIVIMPTNPVNGFYLTGAAGFVNSVEVIEAVCDLYTNSSLGITASDVRSLKSEDIEDTRVSSNMLTTRNSFVGNVEYGHTNVEKWGYSGYTNGTFYMESDGVTIIKTPNIASSTNPIIMKQTAYENNSPVWNSLGNSKFSSETYGTLLGDGWSWLASQSVYLSYNDAFFDVNIASSSAVSCHGLYFSNGGTNSGWRNVRPLVSLSPVLELDKSDTSRDGNTAEKAWKVIKK